MFTLNGFYGAAFDGKTSHRKLQGEGQNYLGGPRWRRLCFFRWNYKAETLQSLLPSPKHIFTLCSGVYLLLALEEQSGCSVCALQLVGHSQWQFGWIPSRCMLETERQRGTNEKEKRQRGRDAPGSPPHLGEKWGSVGCKQHTLSLAGLWLVCP